VPSVYWTVVASHASLLKNKITAWLASHFTSHGTGTLCPRPPKGSRHGDPLSQPRSQSQPHCPSPPHPQQPHCRWSLIICWIKRDRPQASIEIDADHFVHRAGAWASPHWHGMDPFFSSGTGMACHHHLVATPLRISPEHTRKHVFEHCTEHVPPNSRMT
jgi:hypothetical protein